MKLDDYRKFVDSITSDESKVYTSFLHRLAELEASDAHMQGNINIPRLLTAAFGLVSEGGEFTEVVKKIILQGKPYNEDNIYHMKRELGDICWYLAQACMALNTTFDEVIEMNVDKLQARYPGGEFNVHKSENRKEGDL